MEGKLFVELRKLLKAEAGIKYVDLYAGQFDEGYDGDGMPGFRPAVLIEFGDHDYQTTGRLTQKADVPFNLYIVTDRSRPVSGEQNDTKVLTEVERHTDVVDQIYKAVFNYRGAIGDINHGGMIRSGKGRVLIARGQHYITTQPWIVRATDDTASKNTKKTLSSISLTGGLNIDLPVNT